MIYFVSLKFSPAHVNHMKAYASCLKNNDIVYLLSKEYSMFEIELESMGKVTYVDNKNIILNATYIFFNPAPYNHILARQIKRNGGRVIYLYHEPWRGYRAYLSEMKGYKNKLKVFALHYCQSLMLKYSDKIILPSKAAKKMFLQYENKKYKNKIVEINLLFCDEYVNCNEKKYFSFIGTIISQHAFDEYINFIVNNYKNVSFDFMIATKSSISSDDMLKLKPLIQEKRLIINQGKPLTNSEINIAYARSFVCWNAYRHSTQSGVLPQSYMNATPVLATHSGSFDEFVIEGETGEFVDSNYKNVLEKANKIYNDLTKYSKLSRKYFIDNFYFYSQKELVMKTIFEVGDLIC